jgi:hypothetical protein
MLFQQACNSHQDATDAVATLCGLLFDKGGQYNSTDLIISQAMGRLYVFSIASPDGRCASILCLPIDQYCAGATVTTATTKSNGRICTCSAQKMQQIPLGGCCQSSIDLVMPDFYHDHCVCLN